MDQVKSGPRPGARISGFRCQTDFRNESSSDPLKPWQKKLVRKLVRTSPANNAHLAAMGTLPLDARTGQRGVALQCTAGTHTRRVRPSLPARQPHASSLALNIKNGAPLPALRRRRSCGAVLAAAVAEPALAADGRPDPAPQPLVEVAEVQTVPQLWAQLAQRHGDQPAVHDPHQQPQCRATYRQALRLPMPHHPAA